MKYLLITPFLIVLSFIVGMCYEKNQKDSYNQAQSYMNNMHPGDQIQLYNPTKLRNEMSSDPFYKTCCLEGFSSCNGPIEWHHEMQYAGRQLNEKWAILPICHLHHDMAQNSFVKERLQWIALNRATPEELKEVSKVIPYSNVLERLNKIYGKL